MEIPYSIIKASKISDKWLVCIHGFGGSRNMFKKQVEKFKEKFNMLLLDLPGHGESKHGLSEGIGYKLSDVAKGIIDTIHSLGISKADFLGISLGTLIIANIAIINSSIIDKAILGGAVFGTPKLLEVAANVVNLIRGILPYSFVVGAFAYLMMPKKNHKISRVFMIRESRKLGKKEFMAWFNETVHNLSFIKNNIDKINKVHNILIMGNEDYVFMPNVKRIAAKYKMRLAQINKCGHVCNIDKWDEFNSIAMRYLAEA